MPTGVNAQPSDDSFNDPAAFAKRERSRRRRADEYPKFAEERGVCPAEDCGRSFDSEAGFTIHFGRMHAREIRGENAYGCERSGCNRWFSTKAGAARHMNRCWFKPLPTTDNPITPSERNPFV